MDKLASGTLEDEAMFNTMFCNRVSEPLCSGSRYLVGGALNNNRI